jgi:hypothetical protein
MKEKSHHSPASGNSVLNLFNIQTSWMPAFAGMTNYDTVSKGRGVFRLETNQMGRYAFPKIFHGGVDYWWGEKSKNVNKCSILKEIIKSTLAIFA